MTYLLYYMCIGLVSGWLASHLMRGRGFGLMGDILVGMAGAVIGGLVFEAVGLAAYGTIGALVVAFVGSVILLGCISVVKRT